MTKMERIFANFKEDRGANATPGSYDPGDPETYKNYIQAMISDSVDYEGSILAGERNVAQEYYYGMLPRLGGDQRPAIRHDGRSKIRRRLTKRSSATTKRRRIARPMCRPTCATPSC